ncbi:MAG: hypothetical protein FWC00_04005 [Firmicutes bacterium]|nr:hypothetical protein [Bacillota bacterium]
MKTVITIDIWRMGVSAAEIFLPAIYDEFTAKKRQLFDKIQVISNCNIEWKLLHGEVLKSYSNMVLFVKNKSPVRVLFLKDCDLLSVSNFVFAEKCLPGKTSVGDLVKQGKIQIEYIDLNQRTNVKEHGHVQIGSCNTFELLKSMASGFVTINQTGEIKYRVDEITYNPNFECTIFAKTNEFALEIPHKGIIKISDMRWILLQKNGAFTEQSVSKILGKPLN